MCGIGGVFSESALPRHRLAEVAQQLTRLQRHRGPDGEGVWLSDEGRAALAHVRLSILDLTTGAQPMHSSSGNVITFNGEIYNFVELRRELGESRFKTASDTEVILQAYEKWGERCVERLRGMFAFALWDA